MVQFGVGVVLAQMIPRHIHFRHDRCHASGRRHCDASEEKYDVFKNENGQNQMLSNDTANRYESAG